MKALFLRSSWFFSSGVTQDLLEKHDTLLLGTVLSTQKYMIYCSQLYYTAVQCVRLSVWPTECIPVCSLKAVHQSLICLIQPSTHCFDSGWLFLNQEVDQVMIRSAWGAREQSCMHSSHFSTVNPVFYCPCCGT